MKDIFLLAALGLLPSAFVSRKAAPLAPETQIAPSRMKYRGETEFRPLKDIYGGIYKGRCICGYWDFLLFRLQAADRSAWNIRRLIYFDTLRSAQTNLVHLDAENHKGRNLVPLAGYVYEVAYKGKHM